MSTTQVLLPIVGAVEKLNEFLGGVRIGERRQWGASNTTQSRFLDSVYGPTHTLIQAIPEIESVAGRSAEEINQFLASKGFGIRLDPFTDPRDFGVASVLDVLVEWLERGDVHPIRAGGREYPGVRISVKDRHAPALRQRVLFLRHPEFPNPIACLRTQSDDVVYLTVLDAGRVPDLLVSPGPLMDARVAEVVPSYGGVVFPMVSLDQEVDIWWLRGLSTIGADGLIAIVTQAKQQTKFRMNEVGARAESAVALGVMRGGASFPKPDLVIDQPFLCWIERPGIPVPLFLGHITQEDWNNPGSLGR